MTAALNATGLAFDAQSLQSLKSRAASDPKAAVREAARQFEALFMQELVKSMRATTLASGMLDNAGSQMGEQMLDTQFAGALAGRPGGLSDAIMRQLERQMGLAPGPIPATGSANATPAPLAAAGTTPAPVRIPQTAALGFVQQHGEAARSAESATGIPAAFMVAQAAHETGWGRREIRHADGTPSHNLFGIKAGPGWKGPVAEITTTEYVDGQPRKVTAKFRAYGSYAESFADYARLMKTSPRYAAVLERAQHADAAGAASGFATGLQQAGYATDPAYADKLTRVINTTLRLQRSLA
ncbi:MAG: flagellar assembly peptidoglycan hydrolase FlgJ [Rubrivivax sp.]|nr:flagellar assembly peptidoglycan hydrolase FlgJ [Rubrivivax sp.]